MQDPANGQTEASIGAFLARRVPGDVVAIHETSGNRLRVVVTTLSGVNVRLGRVYTTDRGRPGAAWHIRTGRSCWHPKGPSRLVEPTEAVLIFASEHPAGTPLPDDVAVLYGTD